MKLVSSIVDLYRITITLHLISHVSQTQAGTVPLPSYPLAVKNPYLSTWLPGDQVADAATAQPEFWNGQELTWPILGRVNGITYALFGLPNGTGNLTAATTTSVSFTASHTLFQLSAGPVNFTLDFFSPVLPGSDEYARQSLPYAYLTVSASSASGEEAEVQVLNAIDYTWTAQSGGAWLNYTSDDDVSFFWFYNPNEVPFTELADMATYGSTIFGTLTDSHVSYGCGTASDIYDKFADTGSLGVTENGTSIDLAALARDLGTINGSGFANATFAVGLDRTQAISYLGATQTGYYRKQWPTVEEALKFFLDDYETAYKTSIALDSQVRSRAERVSSDFGSQYADIVEASVRQAFGAIDITVPESDFAASPSVFLKEISSDGNVNTVDVIFQSWPIFISLNPDYIRMVLVPILSYLASGRWPKPFVIHDIGTLYPNATGRDDGVEEDMPLFETSSLLILMYAYQKYSGDTDWAQQYLGLLEGYAEYLAVNSLYPAMQLISVDAIAATPNQTALAIQCAIGLNAASILTGNTTYADLASSYVNTIYHDGLGLDRNRTHFTYNYGHDATWNVVFAAYSDVLLNLTTFSPNAWEMQSAWYLKQMQAGGLPFAGPANDLQYTGTPLIWGLTDWNIVASGASSTEVQREIVNTTHAFMTNGLNLIPFGTKYDVEGSDVGRWIGNKARSTVGSHFALLALDQGTWVRSDPASGKFEEQLLLSETQPV